MATQNNNVILLEKDSSSPLRGTQRTVDAADDIVLAPATVSIAPSGNVAINSSSGTLSMGNSASTQAINIGTAGARIITIGQGVGTGPTIVLDGVTNATQIESNGVLAIGSNYLAAESIFIGSGNLGVFAQTRTINIGNTSSSSGVTLYAGSSSLVSLVGPISITSAASSTVISSTSGLVSMDATTTGTIGIGANGGTGAINIGTAATNRTITLGNVTNTGAVIVNAGSGGISLWTNATAGPINVGADNGTGTISIGVGTGTRAINIGSGTANGSISIGTNSVAGRIIQLGTTLGTTSLALVAGTGGIGLTTGATTGAISLTNSGTGAINIGNDTGTGNISIAGTSATTVRYIVIGTGSTGQKTVDIGSNAVAGNSVNLFGGSTGGISIGNEATATGPVNIVGAGATGARSVNVATGGTAAKTLIMGSTASTSATTMQSGTGAMTVTAGGIFDVNATGTVTIDSSTAGINIGADSVSQPINIGINGSRFVTLGATANTSYIALRTGYRGIGLIGGGQGLRGIGYDSTNRSGATYGNGTLLAHQVSPAADQVNLQFVLASAAAVAPASVRRVAGISSQNGSVSAGNSGITNTFAGGISPMSFDVAPAGGADIGKPVYLSTTAGKATLTAPSGSGETIFQVGILARGVADADSNWFVQFMPQFIADIP